MESEYSIPGTGQTPWGESIAPEALSIQRVLARYVELNNIQFMLGEGTRLRAEQIFQPECLMPIIALEADRIWQSLAKWPSSVIDAEGDIGSTYTQDKEENSYFPYIVYPPIVGNDVTSTMRLLVFLLSARRTLGLKENQTIDLLPYIKQWDQIDWEAAQESGEMPEIPVPDGFDLEFQMKEFLQKPTNHSVPVSVDMTTDADSRPQR